MRSIEEVRAAFSELPERVTLRQIADATGRTLYGVKNWVYHEPSFPPEEGPAGPRGVKYRNRDRVLQWLLKQPFMTTYVRDQDETLRRARAADVSSRKRLNTAQISELLGLSAQAGAVNKLARRKQIPPADADGLRQWGAVVKWLERREEQSRRSPVASTRDDRGLTAREQEVLALVDAAAEAGVEVTSAWLAGELGLKSHDSAARLLRAVAPHRETRPARKSRATGSAGD
ncbi:hypothetical protein WKI65_44020 [Streptomyces sp. MS1.AVA.3]|uniref:hypothetical protein n=1 Tax=Streptomyces decoyicus TaxID=249567 RepID=UPI0030BB8EB5